MVKKEKEKVFFELYRIAADRQYRELTKEGNKFHKLNIVKEIFPEASVCEFEFSGIDKNQKKMNVIEFINKYEDESLILIGDGGIGKTTALFHILQSYNNKLTNLYQIPLYIELNRCPADTESWCLDDKNSVFIEKSVAQLLLDKMQVDKKDEFIERIQKEFQKKTDHPEYLILLDGLNEVVNGDIKGYSVRSTLENEIANALNRYTNVRFIITSRNNSRQIKKIREINILGVNKDGIETFLKTKEEKGEIKKGITNKVMKNRELLKCLKIPLFLNMFGVCNKDISITTRGEILRDFFRKKRDSLYSNKIESGEKNGFILDFIIPEVAWEMVLNDTFSLSFAKIQEIINKVLLDKEKSIAWNDFILECFEINDLSKTPRYICDLLLSQDSEIKRTKDILDIVIGTLAIMYADRGEYRFKHHHFRDYFASLHIIDRIKIGVRLNRENPYGEGLYLDDLKKYKLQKSTIIFISESLGLHHTNPSYIPGSGWTMREAWDKNNIMMLQLLDVFRERFNGEVGWALWNIVQIFNASGMGLLGIDLSDLDLRRINFNGVLCGIDIDISELSTKFDNSLIDLNYFLPISHNEILTGVKFSNDGQYILTVSDSKIILWNSNYDYVNKIEVEEKIEKAIFSTNSNYVICYTEKSKIIIWDLWKDQKNILDDNRGKICDLCQGNSDNSIYVAFKTGDVKILQINNHQWRRRTLRLRRTIKQLIFNRKYDQIIIRTENGKVLCGNEMVGHFSELPFSNVKFIAQAQETGEIGIVSFDNQVKIGDLQDEQLRDVPRIYNDTTMIQLSPDGRYVAIVENGDTLRVFDIEENEYKRPLQCDSEITDISFRIGNEHIVTTAGELFANIWEINSNVGVCIRPLGDIADWIRNAYYSPDGKFVATSSTDSTGKIWNIGQRRMVKLLYGHEDRVTSISYDYTGKRVVTTSDDCSAKIWDVKHSNCIRTLSNNEKSVHNATFDANAKKLVTVSWDKTGTIWDLEGKKEPKQLVGHKEAVHTVLFDSSFEKLITCSNDKTAIVWDAKTGKNTGVQVKHKDRLNSAAFSPDGKFLITSSFDKTAKIWTNTGDYVTSLTGHKDSVRSALFSPDGNYIVTVSRDTTGKLWNGHKFTWCKDLIGHTFYVRSAMFDRESKKIVTASYDGSIREWNLEGKCTNIIFSIPGVFVCGCDFRNLNAKCIITERQKELLAVHGALVE